MPECFLPGTQPRALRSGTLAIFFLTCATLATAGCNKPAAPPSRTPQVRLETELGPILLEIDVAHAPISGKNFLAYVEQGAYAGGAFHRAVRLDNQARKDIQIEVIQAGAAKPKAQLRPAIELERTRDTGLRHTDGAISMARAENPASAQSDFFIVIGDQPSLDFGGQRNPDGQGFAAFGRVVSGMDVARKIQHAKTEGENLSPVIKILRAHRE